MGILWRRRNYIAAKACDLANAYDPSEDEGCGVVVHVDFGERDQALVEAARKLHPSNFGRVFDYDRGGPAG